MFKELHILNKDIFMFIFQRNFKVWMQALINFISSESLCARGGFVCVLTHLIIHFIQLMSLHQLGGIRQQN
jgi:hypothetical protein